MRIICMTKSSREVRQVKKKGEKPDLPPDLELLISANGEWMKHFYTLPTEEREKILDNISKTNEIIDNLRD